MAPTPSIALLMTGNELMSGDTVDSNSSRIAQALTPFGLGIAEKCTLGDDPGGLLAAVTRLAQQHAVVVINGGLGPTEDDLTAQVMADACGVSLVENAVALEHVMTWCQRRGIDANPANLKQAKLPQHAEIIDNPRGSAVGIAIPLNQCLLLATPGVPGELGAMMDDLVGRIRARVGGGETHILRLQSFGVGESSVQAWVNQAMPDWPSTVELGFRAGLSRVEIKLKVASTDHLADRERCQAALVDQFGDHIIGEGDTSLSAALQSALRQTGKRVTTAESCTGGLIAAMITSEPGSSDVFPGGFVTYSNALKHAILRVSELTLGDDGAVSEAVVKQMLAGALERSGADVGVAVSGIAGPGGGTDDKPVGTVWMAWGSSSDMRTHRAVIPTSRDVFQTLVASVGMDLVRRFVLDLPPLPHYLARQAI